MQKAAYLFRSTLWLASLLLALTAGALRADTVIPPLTIHNQTGTNLPVLGAYTSLGCVTLTVATASVNLSATGGVEFVITGTAQVLAQWATGTGPWGNAVNLQGTGYLAKQGDLLRFVGNGNGWACISYRTMTAAGSGSSSGSTAVSGTVTANQGTPGSLAWPVADTTTAAILLALSATANSAYTLAATTLARIGAFSALTGAAKTDAAGTSSVAFTASRYVFAASTAYQATTAGMFVNTSSVAGASCNDCKLFWQSNAAGYWDFGSNASPTVPATLGATTGFTISANVTPLLENSFIDGEGIFVKAQAGTVQFVVTTKKRQQ